MKKRYLSFFVSVILINLLSLSYLNSKNIFNNNEYNILLEGFFWAYNNPEVQIVFKISKEKNNTYTGFADFPDYDKKDIPISKIVYNNNYISIKIDEISLTYSGKIKDDNIIMGKGKTQWNLLKKDDWKELKFNLTLNKVKKALGKYQPQTPVKPYIFNEEEVFFKNEKAGITFAASLTTPKSKGPFPVGILISGGGPADRNLMSHRHYPFLVIADYLAKHGIAVLRIDDRGIGDSTGESDHLQYTPIDRKGDIIAAINFLKNHDKIDPDKIGLLGFSEGGYVASMVAAELTDIAFVIMYGSPGLDGTKTVLLQIESKSRAIGMEEKKISMLNTEYAKGFEILKKEKDDEKAEILAREFFEKLRFSKKETEKLIKDSINPWFRSLLTWEPKKYISQIKCPVLAMIGEYDISVPSIHLESIEEALKSGGNNNYKIVEIPRHGHTFNRIETPVEQLTQNEWYIKETVSQVLLVTITEWILENI